MRLHISLVPNASGQIAGRKPSFSVHGVSKLAVGQSCELKCAGVMARIVRFFLSFFFSKKIILL